MTGNEGLGPAVTRYDDTLQAHREGRRVPEQMSGAATAAGHSDAMAGTHTSKTMMLRELRALLGATTPTATFADYARAITDENVLDKATSATRSKTLLHMRHLYTLDGTIPIFAALRELWIQDDAAQPLLAFMCAAARDPLLRVTMDYVLDLPIGASVTPHQLAEVVAAAFPSRYQDSTLHHIGQNAGSSWNQAGFLAGKVRKVRTRPYARPMALAYALYLGHLQGIAGPALFATQWVRLLEVDDYWVSETAAQLGRGGWIDHASSGGMLEVRFSHLDALTEDAA